MVDAYQAERAIKNAIYRWCKEKALLFKAINTTRSFVYCTRVGVFTRQFLWLETEITIWGTNQKQMLEK